METKKEKINHPSHYMVNGKEAITYIEAFDLNFNIGNVVKYLWRSGNKDGETSDDDNKKAVWYYNREVNRVLSDLEGSCKVESIAEEVWYKVCVVLICAGINPPQVLNDALLNYIGKGKNKYVQKKIEHIKTRCG